MGGGNEICSSRENRDGEELLFTASRFRVVRLHEATEEGRRTREIVRHGGSVTVVPLVDEEQICLIRNWRIAVGRALLELPAGTREVDESVETTARRELKEETGYHAEHWVRLPGFYVSPGISDERMELFLAHGLEAGEPERELGEQIENVVLRWSDIERLVDRGEIEDAKTLVGLWYARRWLDRGSGS